MKKELLKEESGILLFSDKTWIDLSQVKRTENRYAWNNSIGSIIKFYALNNYHEYINGEFKILDCFNKNGNRKISILYNNQNFILSTLSVLNANLLVLLSKEFKYSIGDKIFVDHSVLKIIDVKKENNKKYYKYICKNYGYSGWKEETTFKDTVDSGCPCCSIPIKKVVKGINDINTTDNWMIKYLKNKDDGYKYTSGSNESVCLICPDCEIEKCQKIFSLKNDGFSCECKVDGFSYPEKFFSEILRQLKVLYIFQYNSRYCSWSRKYLYDYYLPDYNIIIEIHGRQHYDEIKAWNISLQEESENDKNKKILALKNGISDYIELDCRKSVVSYIKKSIMTSILPKILNFIEDDIDWNLCNEKATSNIIKEICYFYEENKHEMLVTDIASKFNISRYCLRNYLLRGNEFGWCHYIANGRTIAPKKFPKVQIIKQDKVIGIYNSIKELEQISKEKFDVSLQSNTISACASGSYKYPTYKGYSFKYV